MIGSILWHFQNMVPKLSLPHLTSLQVWDASTDTELQQLNGHTDTVTSVAFSHDGIHIVSGSSDKSVWVWDASTGSTLKSGPVPVLGLSGLRPWTGPVLIFPNMEGPRTGPHKTGFTRSWAVLGPVLGKTDS